MTLVLIFVPDFGGMIELATKAIIGGVVYTACALVLDAGGARTQLGRLFAAVQGRFARA